MTGEWTRAKGCAASECVEVRDIAAIRMVDVRNDPGEKPMRLSYEEWQAWRRGVKAGNFDDIAPD